MIRLCRLNTKEPKGILLFVTVLNEAMNFFTQKQLTNFYLVDKFGFFCS